MRFLSLLLLLYTVTTPVFARQRAQGFCERGGNVVVTSGVTSATKVQQSFPGCTVTVYLTGTTTLAALYSDNSGTAKANPFTADTAGYWFFYADNARYDVRLSGGGLASPFILGDVQLADSATSSSTVSWPTSQVTNKPFPDIREYGGNGDGATSNNATLTTIEGLSTTAPIIVPPGVYVATGITPTKRYGGPGQLKLDGVKQAPKYTSIATAPTPNTTNELWDGDQRYADQESYILRSTADVASPTSFYYNYSITPHHLYHETNAGGTGYDTKTTASLSPGATGVTVRSSLPFSPGDQIRISMDGGASSGEVLTINTAGGGSLTFTTAVVGSYSSGAIIHRNNRLLNASYHLTRVGRGGGDQLGWFGQFYDESVPGPDVRSWSQHSTITALGGSMEARANAVGLLTFEYLSVDRMYTGETHHSTAIGFIHNFYRYHWAGYVNTNGTAVTFVSGSGGHFDTTWAPGTTIEINNVSYTIASVSSTTSLTLNTSAGTQTAAYYRVDPNAPYETAWVGQRFTCAGTQYCEDGWTIWGGWKGGLSLAGATFKDNAAIKMASGQRIYMNASATAGTESGFALWVNNHGTEWQEYNAGAGTWLVYLGGTAKFSVGVNSINTGTNVDVVSGGSVVVAAGKPVCLDVTCQTYIGKVGSNVKLYLNGAEVASW